MKTRILIAVLAAFGQSAFAQQPPSSGGLIQQVPPAPQMQRPLPDVRIEHGGKPAAPLADGTRIRVNSLAITGQSAYSAEELRALTGFVPGTELSLTDLRAMAAKISSHYNRNGYVVAQAYLPAQDIKAGEVTIAVVEGRYGKVVLRNTSNLSESLANGLLGGLNTGDTITIGPLEERLLLLSDIPGVGVRSTLVPGANPGTSDLLVDIVPFRRVNGSIEADNHGNRYTGEFRVGGTIHLNNLAGQGDVLSFRGLAAKGLTYGRLSYQAQFGRATVGIAYTALEYRLGREFENLGAHGTAHIASLYGSYPLIRSRNTNLYALAGFDAKTFQDKIDLTSAVTDRKIGVATFGLAGDHRDRFGGGGFNAYSASWSVGELDIETPAARAADALTARSNGSFNRLNFHAMRLQSLPGPFSLYGSIRGQVASKNLDISEKMSLGGAYGVRAYPEGEAYADEGYLLTIEARMLLPKPDRLPGQVHLVGFVDAGSVTLNKNPWLPGDNTRTLSGGGAGLTWADPGNFIVRAYYAQKIGNERPTSAPDKKGRFWIQAVKYF